MFDYKIKVMYKPVNRVEGMGFEPMRSGHGM